MPKVPTPARFKEIGFNIWCRLHSKAPANLNRLSTGPRLQNADQYFVLASQRRLSESPAKLVLKKSLSGTPTLRCSEQICFNLGPHLDSAPLNETPSNAVGTLSGMRVPSGRCTHMRQSRKPRQLSIWYRFLVAGCEFEALYAVVS